MREPNMSGLAGVSRWALKKPLQQHPGQVAATVTGSDYGNHYVMLSGAQTAAPPFCQNSLKTVFAVLVGSCWMMPAVPQRS